MMNDIPKNRKRLIERLDHMTASGQITAEEADRLRAAQDSSEVETAVTEIRVRHARPRLAAAVESGQMTTSEADRNLELLNNGEHPRGLTAHLRKITSKGHG